jgi:hypothetical protein
MADSSEIYDWKHNLPPTISPKVGYDVVEFQHLRKRCPKSMINLEIFYLDDSLEMNITVEPTQYGWMLYSITVHRTYQHRSRNVAAHAII